MGKGAFGVWERAMELERQGHPMIHLSLGEPDFDTPAHIVAAAEKGMREGRTRYGFAAGEVDLREAAARYLIRTRDLPLSAETIAKRILIAPGVKGSLYFAIQTLIEAGDEVLVPTPGYPPYKELVRYTGATPVEYPLNQAMGYQIDGAELRQTITSKTKAIVINTPSNPTGTILNRQSLEIVAACAHEHDLWVLADEVYFQLYYTDERPLSIYELPNMMERTILMDGFSKAYAMTGWRVGFSLVLPQMVEPITKMMVMDHSCLPPFIQDAATVALEGPQDCVVEMRAAFKRRRDAAISALANVNEVSAVYPEGAFYILIDIRQTGYDSETLAYKLLDQGVALLPMGENYLRMAFTLSETDILTAIERLAAVVAQD